MCTPSKLPKFKNEPKTEEEMLELERAARLTCEYEVTSQVK